VHRQRLCGPGGGGQCEGLPVILGDKSLKALAVARQNMLENNLSRMVTCVEADAEARPPLLLGRFDLIAANPPYIPTGDLKTLDSSVRDYEPMLALDGGGDGLRFFRTITACWADALRDGGYIAFECGIGQSGAVEEILLAAGFGDIEVKKDTAGIERVVTGRKNN
jgi:release factor glutamine methyltransferase